MLFNSVSFLFFFPVVYSVYWLLKGSARRIFIISASVLFYAAWGIEKEGLIGLRWTAHFLLFVVLNYAAVFLMFRRPQWKKQILWISVIVNLSNLFVFKYADFLLQNLLRLGAPVPDSWSSLGLFLPLAISFYTFQLMAYVIDVYRGTIKEEVSFSKFFLFILFFPQLIAGPIMRSTDFLDQIDRPELTWKRMYDGSWLIIGGAVKKMLIADPLGVIIRPVFEDPLSYDAASILLAGIGFSIQVYGDFSGYTDMARGSAKLLGYDIPENFLAPFFARSAKELWQRWHITLSSWLRDYIYFPLGGSRVAPWRSYINLIITFTLGGLWHGADTTYMAWGAFWGVLLAGERFLERNAGTDLVPRSSRILSILKVMFMFFLFVLGAIMFRSQPVRTDTGIVTGETIMIQMLAGLFTHFGEGYRFIGYTDTFLMMTLSGMFFHYIQYKPEHFQRFRKYDPYLLPAAAALTGGWLIPAYMVNANQFIYFVF